MAKYRRQVEEEDADLMQPAQASADSDEGYKKRYGDLRRHNQQVLAQKDQEVAAMRAQLDAAAKGQIKFPKSDDEIEQWSKKYPDVAKIVDTIASKRANEALEEGEKRFESLRQLETKLTRKEAEQALVQMHPDFSQIRQDPTFHEWVAEQPLYIQDALYKNNTDAKAASRAIDLYKSDKGKKRTGTKSAAQSVGRTSSSSPAPNQRASYSESMVNSMTSNEFNKHEEAIMESIRTGKFSYDLSGGARQLAITLN